MIGAGRLAAEAAAGVLADEHDVCRARCRSQRATEATVCTVLCVPSSACTACRSASRPSPCAARASGGWLFGVDERLVEHERGVLEAGLEIAVRPLVRRLAHRQLALGRTRRSRPRSTSAPALRRGGGGAPRPPAGVGGAGGRPQTLPSARAFGPPGRRLTSGSTTNGSGSNSIWICSIASAAVSLVDRGDGENRLAFVERLVGQRALAFRVGADGLRRGR